MKLPSVLNATVARAPQLTGRVICFCGIDGSGKSSHLAYVREVLRPHLAVAAMKLVPRQGDFYRMLEPLFGSISDQTYCDLITFERYQRAVTALRRQLRRHDVVLLDRYLYSDIAYGRAFGCSDELPTTLLNRALRPDLTLLFDAPVEVAMSRILKRRRRRTWQENETLLGRARLEFLALVEPAGFTVIDTTRPLAETRAEVLRAISEVLGMDWPAAPEAESA